MSQSLDSLPPTPTPNKKRRWLRSLGRITFAVVSICALAVGLGAYLWLDELGVFGSDDGKIATIVQQKLADNSVVFDRNGEKIGEFFSSYHVYVPYAQLPSTLIDAIVAIEDRNFWTHKGFDPRGILRAMLMQIKGSGSKQGASTLTQQVVRQFILTKERSIQRKIQELSLAMQLEREMPKEKILEIYANSLFLGNGSYGVGAAAQRYFAKSVEQLNPAECALIAGLFQSPSRYNPVRYPKRAKRRQIQVLRAMYAAGSLSFKKTQEFIKQPLQYERYEPINDQTAPYFVDYVREQTKQLLAKRGIGIDGQGLRIHTTLDRELQQFAEASIDKADKTLSAAQARTSVALAKGPATETTKEANVEAALLSVDPKSGEILAMVGGRDYARSKFNRTYQAQRSPGSAFKPVVYSLALQEELKWSDVLYVAPISIDNYRPHTPNEDYLTETTMMRAFYRSMNAPTIELAQKLGIQDLLTQAKNLGIRSPIKAEYGSALGSSDVNMFDLARMYSAFANEGQLVEPIAISKITDREGKILYQAPAVSERQSQAVSPQIAFLMTQGMRAVLGMGTGYTSAHLSNVAGGKTGTSNDSTDNWFCGYAPNLATIVWVGTDEHVPMRGDVTGGKLALPIWDQFMTQAFSLRPPGNFKLPEDVVAANVHPLYGNRSPRGVRMYFLRGQEPSSDGSALESLSKQAEGVEKGNTQNYRGVFSH